LKSIQKEKKIAVHSRAAAAFWISSQIAKKKQITCNFFFSSVIFLEKILFFILIIFPIVTIESIYLLLL
jgi:hypothetical protein